MVKYDPYQIIIRPVITEKANRLRERENKYVFEVHPKANKSEVKRAIQEIFGVKVLKVNIMKVKPKPRRMRWRLGYTSVKKKAIVKLAEGQKISVFEGGK